MCIKKLIIFIFGLLTAVVSLGQSRNVIHIPDIPGYITLKCDFHMHTVFSDGTVWPTVRVEEAWEEGLDAISITDHIENKPHSKDIDADHNRSYEIALPLALEAGILLVKAAEITRGMPPGHFNTLFISNANLLERDDVMDAIREARDQGAFIMWNHPGWKKQQPDTTLWWEEHTYLLENDLLHGIEIYNEEFYPEALNWADEKELTIFCNSDVHEPMRIRDGHRDMTLVFARERTVGGIREALFDGRTVAYFGNMLVGDSKLLEGLFFGSLEYNQEPLQLKNKQTGALQILNRSDVDYELELVQPGVGFDAPQNLVVKAHHVTPLLLSGNSDEVNNMSEVELFYQVKNMKIKSGEPLVVTFTIRNN